MAAPVSIDSPRLSVIMPAYNAARYLRKAVESILSQSFRDFEFIVIDDGSIDSTRAILEGYAAKDSRLRVISRANTGYTKALLEMMALARGSLVARMDADDIALPDRFEKQLAAFDADSSIVLVGGSYEYIDDAGRRIRRWTQPTDHATLDAAALSGGNPFCHPLVMFRRVAYDRVGGYDVSYEPAEDLDLWLKLAEVGKVANVPDVLLLYRQHAASVSQTRQAKQVDRIRAACEAALMRRGISKTLDIKPWRPADEGVASRYATTTTFGWWALKDDHRATARVYAIKAIALMPWRSEGWKLLAKSIASF